MVEAGVFYIPADAHRDKTTMEWLYAMKDFDSETDTLYNEVILKRHMDIAQTGGIKGLRKLQVSSTGYADIGDDNELAIALKNGSQADETLVAMTQQYGQESLEQMKPNEFYRLYKDFAIGRH